MVCNMYPCIILSKKVPKVYICLKNCDTVTLKKKYYVVLLIPFSSCRNWNGFTPVPSEYPLCNERHN